MKKSTWSTKDIVTVAVAFDAHAPFLVEAAARLCRRTCKTLALVHIVESIKLSPFILPFASSPVFCDAISVTDTNLRAAAARHLDELASTIGPGIAVLKIVAAGSRIEALCREADGLGSSLLIVGANYADQKSPPRSGFATAFALLSSSPVPVLVVDTRYAKGLFQGPVKIMVADDLGAQTVNAVQFAVDLAIGLGNTALGHVHVNGVREDVLRSALTAAVAASHTPANPKVSAEAAFAGLVGSLVETLQSRVAGDQQLLAKFGCTYKAFVPTGEVTERLAALASDIAPDLLCFGRHHAVHNKPFFIGRAPLKAMLALRHPVLIVPEAS